jgi:hypothetical protein
MFTNSHNPYSSEEFREANEGVQACVLDEIVTGQPGEYLSEYEIREHFMRCCSKVAILNITSFTNKLLSALYLSGRQFSFDRKDKRSYFGGIKLRQGNNETARYKRPARIYRKNDDSASILKDAVTMLKKHVHLADDAKVRVKDLKQVYEHLTDLEADACLFSDVLDALIDGTEGLELEEKVNKKTGKRRLYVKGLELV